MKFKKEKKAVTIYDIVCHNIPKGTTVILKGVNSCDSGLYYVLTPNDGVKLIHKDDLKPLKPKKKKNKLEKRVEQLTKNLLYLGKRVTDLEDNQTESEAITPSSKIIVPETPNKKVINPSDKTLEERLEELECEITKRTNTSRCGYDVWFTDSLGWYQLIILEGTEDEIVEKVKQIIEILK